MAKHESCWMIPRQEGWPGSIGRWGKRKEAT
jgi:hypothetical protein